MLNLRRAAPALRLLAFALVAAAVSVRSIRVGMERSWAHLAVVLPQVGTDPDLDDAISAGRGRQITGATPPVSIPWTDLGDGAPGNRQLISAPVSLCWRGDQLAVADADQQRVVLFDSLAAPVQIIGGRGVRPGQFLDLSVVRCGQGKNAYLTVDAAQHRVTFFEPDGKLRDTLAAPRTPQFNVYPGDFAIFSSGEWVDSWLGSVRSTGPYLSADEWTHVRLLRFWDARGRDLSQAGEVYPYRSLVARRVLNRVFLAEHRDTLWILTQANAAIRGFDVSGREVTPPVLLPIYYRGREPRTIVEPVTSGDGWRPNLLVYQPNVQAIGILHDSLFLTLRYRDWALGLLGRPGSRYLDYRARSAVEVIDRQGRVLRAFKVPGFARALATDGAGRVAVLTDDADGNGHVLISTNLLAQGPDGCSITCSATGARP